MNEKYLRYYVDTMPFQSGDPVGIYIRKHSNVTEYPHTHDCYEIELITKGKVKEIINTTEYNAKPGDIFLLTPNDFHQLKLSGDLEIINIMFKGDIIHKKYLQAIYNLNFNSNIATKLDAQEYDFVNTILDNAIEEYKNRNEDFEFIISDTINIIIAMIVRKSNYKAVTEIKDNAIRKAMIYMQQNCNKDITLEEVSKYVGLNTAYFSNKFHNVIGTNFRTYLFELRLAKARQMLLTTDLAITDICFLSGFSSLSSFYREFKKLYKVTPQNFRQTNKEDKNE